MYLLVVYGLFWRKLSFAFRVGLLSLEVETGILGWMNKKCSGRIIPFRVWFESRVSILSLLRASPYAMDFEINGFGSNGLLSTRFKWAFGSNIIFGPYIYRIFKVESKVLSPPRNCPYLQDKNDFQQHFIALLQNSVATNKTIIEILNRLLEKKRRFSNYNLMISK